MASRGLAHVLSSIGRNAPLLARLRQKPDCSRAATTLRRSNAVTDGTSATKPRARLTLMTHAAMRRWLSGVFATMPAAIMFALTLARIGTV
jgi:hypothetical protein